MLLIYKVRCFPYFRKSSVAATEDFTLFDYTVTITGCNIILNDNYSEAFNEILWILNSKKLFSIWNSKQQIIYVRLNNKLEYNIITEEINHWVLWDRKCVVLKNIL